MVAQSAAGALRKKTTNFMCRDLGTLTPNCMVVKVRQSGLYSGNSASAVGDMTNGTITTDKAYLFALRMFAFGGSSGLLANGTDHSGSATAWTQKAANAVGAVRLLGTAGSTALYKLACTLRVQGYITLEMPINDSTYVADSASHEFNPTRSGTHFYHIRDIGETAPTIPATQAELDILFAQPDFKRKLTTGMDTSAFAYRTTVPDAKAALGSVTYRSLVVRWKVNEWVHRALDMTYPAFVSDANSFNALNAAPTNYMILDLLGFFNSLNGGRLPPQQIYMRYNLVFSVLLKDPLPGIS